MICRKCKQDIPDTFKFCNYCGAKQTINTTRNPKRRGNGQGSVYKLPNGKYIAVRTVSYHTTDTGALHRKYATKTFTKKSDAIAALPTLFPAVEKTKDCTLFELHEIYIQSKDYDALSDSQRKKLSYAWDKWNPLHHRKITTLTVDDLQSTIDNATSTYYPAHDMAVAMSHLYKIAIRKEIVSINKTEYIDLPDQPKAKRECWTEDEIIAFWKDYELNHFTAYILIMCYCGLRYGEISTILLDNINLIENYMVGGIKSEAGRNREIPICNKIRPVIVKCMGGTKKLLEMSEDDFYRRYWDVIDRTGVRKLKPHTCRHWFFSRLTAAGIQGGLIAEIGGHASFLTTLKNYVRIPLSDKLTAVNTIQ